MLRYATQHPARSLVKTLTEERPALRASVLHHGRTVVGVVTLMLVVAMPGCINDREVSLDELNELEEVWNRVRGLANCRVELPSDEEQTHVEVCSEQQPCVHPVTRVVYSHGDKCVTKIEGTMCAGGGFQDPCTWRSDTIPPFDTMRCLCGTSYHRHDRNLRDARMKFANDALARCGLIDRSGNVSTFSENMDLPEEIRACVQTEVSKVSAQH